MTKLLIAAAAAVSLASGAFAQGKLEKKDVHVAVGGKAALYYLPLTISEQLGYFKAEGLDVEISDFAGGAKALQALVGGTADVVLAAPTSTPSTCRPRTSSSSAFVLQGRAPQIAIGVSTKAMPTTSRRRISRARRSASRRRARRPTWWPTSCSRAAGLKATDVSFIGVGTAAGALAALRSGQIDAMRNTDPVMTMLEQKGDVKIISDTRTLRARRRCSAARCRRPACTRRPSSSRRTPTPARRWPMRSCTALKWLQTARPAATSSRPCPRATCSATARCTWRRFNKVREAISPDGMHARRRREDGAEGPRQLRARGEGRARSTWRKTYTNDFVRRRSAKDTSDATRSGAGRRFARA